MSWTYSTPWACCAADGGGLSVFFFFFPTGERNPLTGTGVVLIISSFAF